MIPEGEAASSPAPTSTPSMQITAVPTTDERPSPPSRKRRALRGLAVFAFVGGLAAFGLLPCPFAIVTRHPCPGCGLTRATKALLHLDVHAALAFHPLVLLILPTLSVWFGLNLLFYVRDGHWGWVEARSGKGVTWAATAMMLLVLGVWIARFFGAFGGPVSVNG